MSGKSTPTKSQSQDKEQLVFKDNPAAYPKREVLEVETFDDRASASNRKMSKTRGSTIWTTDNKAKHLSKNFNEIMGIVPVTPRKSDLISLIVLLAIPVFLFILGFSGVGYGIRVFRFLSQNPNYGSYGFVMAFFIGSCMYMLDGEYWDGEYDRTFWSCECLQKFKPLNKFRKLILTVASVFFISGVLFRVEDYPYGPICIFLILLVLYITGVKRLVMGKSYDTRQYVGTLPIPLVVTATWTFVWWVIWTNQEPRGIKGSYRIWSPSVSPEYVAWSAETKLHYAERIKCTEDADIDDKTEDIYSACLSPFMIWSTPAVVAFALVIFALTAYVLDPNDAHGAPKMVGQFILVLLFGMWCSASLSGAGSVLTTAILAFVFASLIAVCGFVVYTCGLEMFKEPDKQPFVLKMKAKYGGMADVLRGLLIVTCAPLILGFFALSFINQLIRKLPCIPITKRLDDSDRHLMLTKIGSAMYTNMTTWKWTDVLVYALYWGIFFFTCNVIISQFTILFLSWLIVYIAEFSLMTVSAIFFVVGFIMFMLPPVPGVPVYLSSGIILIAAGEKTYGLSGSIIYAFIFCMVLKLMAVVGQMYLFGVPLGKYVSVRRTVGVNTPLVRTMKVVLSKPGFSIAKVTVLTGGPDWPTSVMCGILNLNVFQILLGTLPVALLILPTILAGSYFYLSDRDPKFQTLATIFAATAALVQSGSMLVAAYYLDKAAIVYKDEIDAMPLDEEVRIADEAAAVRKLRYAAATEWSVQPCFAKFLLILATFLMVICCYIVQLVPCFEPYELTSRIRTLPGGKWYNLIIWPQGFVAIAFFCASFFVFVIYNKWSTCRANRFEMPPAVATEEKT
jgi:hypothetical protein